MSPTRSSWTHRLRVLFMSMVVGPLLWPQVSYAAPHADWWPDIGGWIESFTYSTWEGIAQALWAANRVGLQVTYAIHQVRWWIVEVAFSFLYDILEQLFGPLLIPVATIAILIGLFSFVVSPVVGRLNIVDVRHAFLWAVLAPMLLTWGGTVLLDYETTRMAAVDRVIRSAGSVIASVPSFGAKAADMGTPTPLYAGNPNPCGTGPLVRREEGLMPDDMAAGMVAADLEDIFCPEKDGPSSDLPDSFYVENSPTGFATLRDVANELTPIERKNATAKIKRGVVRLLMLLVGPTPLSVVDAAVQLLLALCSVVLFLSLPFALAAVFFRRTMHGVSGLCWQAVAVFQVSLTIAAVLVLFLICLRATATYTNAALYTGLAFLAACAEGYFLVVAVQTLTKCLTTFNQIILTTTGLAPSGPIELAGNALATAGAAGLAAATGGASMVITGAQALRATGDGTYAVAAALGRNETIHEVGQVAAGLGLLSEQSASGLYAGYRSTRSTSVARRQMQRDAAQRDELGRTMRDRQQERRLEDRDLAVGKTYTLDGDGELTTPFEMPPDDALTLPADEARLPRLLALGYHVRSNTDDTITVWKIDQAAQERREQELGKTVPAVAHAQARLELIKQGALKGDALTARQELRNAVSRASTAAQQDAAPTGAPHESTTGRASHGQRAQPHGNAARANGNGARESTVTTRTAHATGATATVEPPPSEDGAPHPADTEVPTPNDEDVYG